MDDISMSADQIIAELTELTAHVRQHIVEDNGVEYFIRPSLDDMDLLEIIEYD